MMRDNLPCEERLHSMPALMRDLVGDSIRTGMRRGVPDPVEARHLAEVHARLLQRIRAMELALQEFEADRRRVRELFERVARHDQRFHLQLEEQEQARAA